MGGIMYFKFLISVGLFFAVSVFGAHHESSVKAEYSKQQIT